MSPHQHLKDLRAFINRRNGSAVMLGEVNLPHAQQREYFGGDAGDELHMMFDFIGMQKLYLSLAREDARPLAKALLDRPPIHPSCQWATFVRNHDELTLDKLTDKERQEVFAAFGPEPEMQIYDRGLKRRLPPMLGGDPRRVRMAYSLLFSLPGTPTLFYGEEIGMGEDLAGEGRHAVRTPMQWTAGPTGGFSTAPPRKLVRTAHPRRLRARARQRRLPAHRPRLALELHAPPRPDLPLLPRAGVGRLHRPRPAATSRCSRTSAPPVRRRSSPSTTSAPSRRPSPSTSRHWVDDGDIELADLLAGGEVSTERRRARGRPRRLRLPLAAGPPGG